MSIRKMWAGLLKIWLIGIELYKQINKQAGRVLNCSLQCLVCKALNLRLMNMDIHCGRMSRAYKRARSKSRAKSKTAWTKHKQRCMACFHVTGQMWNSEIYRDIHLKSATSWCTGTKLCMCSSCWVCWMVMSPAAVTQQSHHPAEEGKWSDVEAAKMKMEKSWTIIMACGHKQVSSNQWKETVRQLQSFVSSQWLHMIFIKYE